MKRLHLEVTYDTSTNILMTEASHMALPNFKRGQEVMPTTDLNNQ